MIRKKWIVYLVWGKIATPKLKDVAYVGPLNKMVYLPNPLNFRFCRPSLVDLCKAELFRPVVSVNMWNPVNSHYIFP